MSAPSGDDSSTDSDDAQQPFYGPLTGPTMHERRARWSLLSRRIAGATSSGKKRRKVEETASFVPYFIPVLFNALYIFLRYSLLVHACTNSEYLNNIHKYEACIACETILCEWHA